MGRDAKVSGPNFIFGSFPIPHLSEDQMTSAASKNFKTDPVAPPTFRPNAEKTETSKPRFRVTVWEGMQNRSRLYLDSQAVRSGTQLFSIVLMIAR